MKSEAISHDIESLERELASLRLRVEGDGANFATLEQQFATLEQQIAELRENLVRTRETVAEREARLAEKHRELAEAKRLETLSAYEDDLRAQRETGERAAAAATEFLATLDAYDDATLNVRQLLEEMRAAFGHDERVSEVELAVQEEPPRLLGTWEAVMAATKWRLNMRFEDTVEAEEFPEDLHDLGRDRGPTRLLKEYFGKS